MLGFGYVFFCLDQVCVSGLWGHCGGLATRKEVKVSQSHFESGLPLLSTHRGSLFHPWGWPSRGVEARERENPKDGEIAVCKGEEAEVKVAAEGGWQRFKGHEDGWVGRPDAGFINARREENETGKA